VIVLEVKFVANKAENVSMEADILGRSKDPNADEECKDFETEIIPQAYQQIERIYKNKTLADNENLCVDMMNVLVRQAKQYNYRLNRIGQNKKYPDMYQLEFIKETNERFAGLNREIPDEI
jgi:hypothetical protein